VTIIAVSNTTQLNAALSSVQAGDTITLAAGNYGDLGIKGKLFAGDVTINSQDASNPAVFHSLNIAGSSHVHVDDVTVNFTASSTTYAFSPAVKIDSSSAISLTHSTVLGGTAVNGVSPDATYLDSTQNVLGMPTGYGVNITHSTGVTIDGGSISHVNEAVVLGSSDHVTISNNDIHDMRKSGIVGSGLNQVTIDHNHIHDSNPWHWGSGDHADFLALWTDSTQTAPSTGVAITNNLMEQGNGAPVLGMWLQGGAVTFTNATISNNAFLDGNNQGITLSGVSNSSVDHNVLMQTSGDAKAAPSILLAGGTQDVAVTGNLTAAIADTSGSTGALANTVSSNQFVQAFDFTAAGYYNTSLLSQIETAYGTDTYLAVAKLGVNGGIGDLLTALDNNGDLLTANNIAHIVVGGTGNDTFIAGSGNDTFTGAGGADSFVIGYKTAHDTISDFGAHDTLDLSAFLKVLKPVIHDVGNDVTISFSSGEAITLTGVHAANLIATSTGFTI
jgi:hypothetical protein